MRDEAAHANLSLFVVLSMSLTMSGNAGGNSEPSLSHVLRIIIERPDDHTRCTRPPHQQVAATSSQYRIADFNAQIAVHRAVDGAARRLANGRCQLLTAEFADRQGVSLTVRLNALGMTLSQYLDTLRFVDAPDSHPCRRNSAIVAFTTPGERTVSVCPVPFKRLYRADSFAVEFIVIHEVLHTLGLGENPPTPQAITERVIARCQ